MMGERITVDDLFKRREDELRRETTGPAFEALMQRNHAKFQREEAARLAWEAEHPKTSFDLGREDAECGGDGEPPDDLSDEDQEAWRAGYASLGSAEE